MSYDRRPKKLRSWNKRIRHSKQEVRTKSLKSMTCTNRLNKIKDSLMILEEPKSNLRAQTRNCKRKLQQQLVKEQKQVKQSSNSMKLESCLTSFSATKDHSPWLKDTNSFLIEKPPIRIRTRTVVTEEVKIKLQNKSIVLTGQVEVNNVEIRICKKLAMMRKISGIKHQNRLSIKVASALATNESVSFFAK